MEVAIPAAASRESRLVPFTVPPFRELPTGSAHGSPVPDIFRCGTHRVTLEPQQPPSTIPVVGHSDHNGYQDERERLVRYGVRMLDDGLAIGSAGNMSERTGDQVLITPSGIPYRDLQAADICVVDLLGDSAARPSSAAVPSTETPMHLAIYAATEARAVVHTHSPEVIALSAVCDELPAIHYAIVSLGGPVRVARYTRFGSADLARAAVAALDGRTAAILQNHGAVSYGPTLAEAYDRALLLEWLARVHRLAWSRAGGRGGRMEPRILTEAELSEVRAEMRRIRYGEATGRGGGQ
jgi:L-fuculose-phosphate aldolase